MATRRRAQAVVRDLEAFASEIVASVALDTVANLKRAPSEGGTPVDTGWARANWVPRIGSPTDPVREPSSREERSAAVGSALAKQSAGEASVATRYRLRMGPVYVSNPVPYIVRLNAGSSQQAAANFVQRAIATAIASTTRKFSGLGRR